MSNPIIDFETKANKVPPSNTANKKVVIEMVKVIVPSNRFVFFSFVHGLFIKHPQ